ncbi:MAG TPA: FtsX-like permease family protein, partial [Bryobacteraceae bacterium]|nr:FtsX-like permease family protein [Bryobacteraceae bacterium]
RDFSFADASRSRVAIVSQAMARYYFPGQNAIGKYIQIDKDPRTGGWYGTDDPYEIIGVAGDAKYTELREPPPRTMYLNMFQENRIAHQFALRTSVEPAAVAAAARAEVRRHVSNVRIARVTTLTEQVDAALVPERLIATLTGYFGTLGAVLAGIGLYGLLAYTVTRRTNEIGVRMALGATSAHIRRMVAMDALVMVGGGIAIGTAMVAWSKPLASRLIQDLKPEVPTALALAGAAIIGVAVVASYAPARRASRVDPLVALRHD